MIAQLGNDVGVGHDDNRLPEFLRQHPENLDDLLFRRGVQVARPRSRSAN